MMLTILYIKQKLPSISANNTGNLLKPGINKNTTQPITLNSKCARAMLNASTELNIAAINAVIGVPILAPTIYGYSFFK